MKGIQDILLLGNPLLHKTSEPVLESELGMVSTWVAYLHNVMQEVRRKYNFGRAIAAPQLGIMKRLIYMNVEQPIVIINPEITSMSPETFTLWDDCMCFPNLLVEVERYKEITLNYRDEKWHKKSWEIKDDLSELIQHEYDHLNGILCTERAIHKNAFKWRRTPE